MLDFAVLKYRNQKLCEQLEVHKFEYRALEGKVDDLKKKQKAHNDILNLVNKSWEHLVRDLEVISVCESRTENSSCSSNVSMDGACIPNDKDFLSRLIDTSATENSGCHLENHVSPPPAQLSTADVLQNVVFSSNDLWRSNKKFSLALLAALPENECSTKLRSTSNELSLELDDAIQALGDLHLKHRQITEKYHNQRYSDARSKAEKKCLKEELACTVAELEESNHKLAVLKAQRDTTHGTPILFPTLGNKNNPGDNVRGKPKELQDLEASLNEFTDLISKRLLEIRRLHEEKIETLNKLATFQNTLTDFKSISSSIDFEVLSGQLQKSRAELDHWHTLLEKLQVHKDKLSWQEREINGKVDLAEIPHRVSSHCESTIADLEQNLRKVVDEKNMLVLKLEYSSGEPEFKALVSSLPREMGVMQSELSKYKDDASELHSLRAEVHSLSDTLSRKEHAISESLCRSSRAGSEIRDLRSRVCDLRQTHCELKLFVEMYKHESTDYRDVQEFKDRENYEWAHVHSLKSSLDESRLKQRVKAANEAEAMSQKRLASAEAEIAQLREIMDASRRDIGRLSELLKSKHEEGEAYLSEIESIGQAYEDIQTQNQQLLQQIIERDDHNTKIFMEGVKVKQTQDALHLELCTLSKNLWQANNLMDLYKEKIAVLDDKFKVWSEQVGRLSEDTWCHSVSLGNAQRKLVDAQGETQQLRLSMEKKQAKVGRSRLQVAELSIELEKDRFSKRRIEDDLELMSRKASALRAKTEGSSMLEKIHQEVKEYRGILKCGVCRDRQKEVVIAKCYHLFCNECIQKSVRNRQRRCPSCGLSFGANDVKPIYI